MEENREGISEEVASKLRSWPGKGEGGEESVVGEAAARVEAEC